ncbi:hypothetical protein C2S52_014251 [Perilla frutescens var. hirtella]|uniref:Uncharacterized protein n=1 Tax=Perilla frutescens var. hirtella TaxID=608512 RepID=A0AAD4PCT3_PERFH|nr:hypothetical protein C2S51_016447 [Perilla frutescens var. frutescens]KAH6776690.1 hypothetical protein C2S52_014251 [Perilla frutescens var. hirtella]KAH6834132.1 hypothetical protein C2S53_017906 [Perilla frutescens var. hirtella]
MATTEEDFTFPTDSPPRFFDSPPLWRRSSSAAAKGKEVGDGGIFNPPYFQEMRGGSAKVRSCTSLHDEDDEEQEKMDLLWENLNDDQCGKTAQNSDISSPRRDVQISCVKALKLSKASGRHMISGKKTSILVFIKVLKKVFLMHNSQRAIKKKPYV